MTLNPAPRIGIIGTGAIGGFYGLLLARAGFDVHFLLRSEYPAVAANGLQLNSQVHGALHLQPVQAYRHAEDMPACDWLLVGAKTTANAELAPLINQAAAPGARVVLLQNGLGVETALRPLLDDGLHLLGGLCYICVHRSAPGVIEHQALGAINLAYHSGPAEDDEARRSLVDEGAELFRKAGLDSQAMAKLEQTRWQKLVWNVPYNGLSVLLDADTKAMMGNPSSRALIRDLMLEVVQAAQALGHDMPENYADKLLAATERMPDYLPSMYYDFAQRRPAELQAIYATPLAAAAAAGQDMPKVRALYQALQFLQARQEA
ncbi:putative 2-dehydropantoate 2-reductase [Pseudomonas sp. GOM7]|uniref:putative 2-dehydropantoate 2-reductase n=1 Tax=Pseudomonas sp. GOM7 TaxID=2998079 RepID=UPI00227BFCAD|nr:putative 2-dehydropantoate 2-reductase [Pseudomonas sp. GOM7]WAJ35684.1 putative 2-dehydropantoate 2-reductase [Pseudomonas sp. GOM7]